MKKLLLFSFAILLTGITNAQSLNAASVPSSVKSSLHDKFPKGANMQWSKINKDEYSAEFDSDGKKIIANFSSAGLWRATQTVIKSTDLSKAIRTTIAKQFAGYKVMKSVRAEGPGKPFLFIEELNKGKVTVQVTFSADGKVVSKEDKAQAAK